MSLFRRLHAACVIVSVLVAAAPVAHAQSVQAASLFPASGSTDVNPDTHLVLTFASAPVLAAAGKIRIVDAADNRLVDTLDLAIPAAPPPAPKTVVPYTDKPYDYATARRTNADTVPGTPSGRAVATPANAQLTIIGGFSDAFHFYPVIVRGKVATIYPHHNLLAYNHSYYVEIDAGIVRTAEGEFAGIKGPQRWTFTTRRAPPPANAARLVVAADGSGDFNTVQGALDAIPDFNTTPVTVFIKNGVYEEIVYFRNKRHLVIVGEDRDKVVVKYANNEVFNPHPANIGTNELPGSFPSRRAAFMADNAQDVALVNFSIVNQAGGQAEGLLISGEHNIVSRVSITGAGDALQVNGPTYLEDCQVTGTGDTVLSRGPAFFRRCELHSQRAFVWGRNTAANHGDVFVDSRFITRDGGVTDISRAPSNKGKTYPFAEVVLIDATLDGISAEGWGDIDGDTANLHFWEYRSVNGADGRLVDVSRRKRASRQLALPADAQVIADYRNPAYVLGGWTPTLAPQVLTQPVALVAGGQLTFSVTAAALPAPTYQWTKDGVPIAGARAATLTLSHPPASDAGQYAVRISNAAGSAMSAPAEFELRSK